MPNNTANKIQFVHFAPGKLNEIEDFLKSEASDIDFKKVIPLNDREPREAWGTKWNAYNVKKVRSTEWRLTYFFETAWKYPEPIILSLLNTFPDVDITVCAACEGGWFAVVIRRQPGDEKPTMTEFTTNNGNDPDGLIRKAMMDALHI